MSGLIADHVKSGGAAVVVNLDRNSRTSVRIRRRRVGQDSGWRDGWLHAEQCVVVVRDNEVHLLPDVAGPRASIRTYYVGATSRD